MAIYVNSKNSTFEFKRIYQISMTTSGWKLGEDYTLALRVTDASGAERRAEFGTAVNWGKTAISCLFVVGDTVSVTATPIAEVHPNFNAATWNYIRLTADAAYTITDVSRTSWFYADAAFVYEKGLFSGTDSSTFSPDASMTRAMLVTVLYRLEGQPAVTGSSSFADVKSGVYYERAVIWAAANGIVTGTGSASFSPDAKVTREQLAAILYRYAQYRKLDTSANAKLNGFSDADNVSGYASAALGWAVAEGLVNGASGRLMPKGNATRAQVAAIFHRFVENVMN